MNIRLAAACFITTAALLGCRGEGGGGADSSATDGDGRAGAKTSATGGVAAAHKATAPAEPSDAAAEARSRAALEQRLAEIEAVLQRLPGLIGSIRQDMRQHLNATHLAAARSNGVGPVRDNAHLATLVDRGALVQLPESTRWWVLRDLNHSLPYVTPGTRAALEEVGRRFHARLDEHGLPPFRLDITSVLRTSEQQSELQRRNANAADTTSSHARQPLCSAAAATAAGARTAAARAATAAPARRPAPRAAGQLRTKRPRRRSRLTLRWRRDRAPRWSSG